MEKNRIRPVKAGKGIRMSYSRQKEVLEMPNLIEVQKDSYQWFLDVPKNVIEASRSFGATPMQLLFTTTSNNRKD